MDKAKTTDQNICPYCLEDNSDDDHEFIDGDFHGDDDDVYTETRKCLLCGEEYLMFFDLVYTHSKTMEE